jgi:hypothetical protein
MAGTSSPSSVSTELHRIATLAKELSGRVLTTLAHHIDVLFLQEAYRRTRKGSVARFHLRDVPLCGSTEREMEERREDELQGEPLGARNDSVGGALVCGLSHCVSAA